VGFSKANVCDVGLCHQVPSWGRGPARSRFRVEFGIVYWGPHRVVLSCTGTDFTQIKSFRKIHANGLCAWPAKPGVPQPEFFTSVIDIGICVFGVRRVLCNVVERLVKVVAAMESDVLCHCDGPRDPWSRYSFRFHQSSRLGCLAVICACGRARNADFSRRRCQLRLQCRLF